MKKQYALPILFFTLGIAITIIGALFKIMHWPGANALLMTGLLSEAAALIILIISIAKRLK
ncbi:MAG: hypothetical protein RL259_495 [Bacteroidota bacterium]|jgi:hypothetical protein